MNYKNSVFGDDQLMSFKNLWTFRRHVLPPTFTLKLEAANEGCTDTYSIVNFLKEINWLQAKEADFSCPNFAPTHWDIGVKKALVARHKGSFTQSTVERDVLKTFTTRQLLRTARKCSPKCQSNALSSSADMANFAPGRSLHVPKSKCTKSTAPGWGSRYRWTGKKAWNCRTYFVL